MSKNLSIGFKDDTESSQALDIYDFVPAIFFLLWVNKLVSVWRAISYSIEP